MGCTICHCFKGIYNVEAKHDRSQGRLRQGRLRQGRLRRQVRSGDDGRHFRCEGGGPVVNQGGRQAAGQVGQGGGGQGGDVHCGLRRQVPAPCHSGQGRRKAVVRSPASLARHCGEPRGAPGRHRRSHRPEV
jgi:hypothetical protein